MDEGQLAELGRYFDEYMFGDPKKPETQQAIFCFKSIARDVFAGESEDMKKKLTFEHYIAVVINPEVMAFLDRRQAKHPVVTPERVNPTSQ
jgi:hypothetical protein